MTDCGVMRKTPHFPIHIFWTMELSLSTPPCCWFWAGWSCCSSPTHKKPSLPGLRGSSPGSMEGWVGVGTQERKQPCLCVKLCLGGGNHELYPALLSFPSLSQKSLLISFCESWRKVVVFRSRWPGQDCGKKCHHGRKTETTHFISCSTHYRQTNRNFWNYPNY